MLARRFMKNSLGRVKSYEIAKKSINMKPRFISFNSNIDKFKIKPTPPGGVIGDVNQAYKPPEADYFHGSYHWLYERSIAVALLPLSIYSIFTAVTGGVAYPMIDVTTGLSALFYLQYEYLSCITDYIPKRKFQLWHNIAKSLLYSGSAVAAYGLYDIHTNNNGFTNLIKKTFVDDESNLYIFGRY
ncbi:hypothetical protein TPHA_0I00740 [Tetrapisispora phaffii CBS 4417]|uniref:Succinate dehydrogenase [ubiquinone] cytochrome b small subunit n=1 Tax=Tetrapisispora phaffii (strain ATCC 24235 / CBS 4417 / NBRC 1672 / NRRL Y-8282 / UCD 70-5) TaxID=1071381 RepID=G8BXF2_TETPH|nr:hypothetical protein TPHA_0I00740 [Tetrapisispora phaffii CBS 4417]CCE64580.1 hypothetical protein TPHA_0I00740 [Tetrapisispora phaffii CBS 4417]